MTITPLTIYLVSLCDSADMLAVTATVMLLVVCAFCLFGSMVAHDQDNKEHAAKDSLTAFRWACFFGASALIAALVAVAIPSSKTAAAMLVIPAVVNNERVQGLADKGADLAETLLGLTNEWAKEKLAAEATK